MQLHLYQPNGSIVDLYSISESGSCYSKEDMDKGKRNTFLANVYVRWEWGTHHCPFELLNKRFWYDNIGLYTYKGQRIPIYRFGESPTLPKVVFHR